jgi:peptidoglycan hydrolase-like protein with peptidoglycan-binding domain
MIFFTSDVAMSRVARTGLCLLVATGLGGAVALAGTAAPASATTSVEQSFASDLNHERTAADRPALTVRSDLEQVARGQAERMASSGTLYHNPNLTAEVTNWRWVGENVGYGPDEATVHAAFMASPAHRDNILSTDYTELGIGVVVSGGRVWVAEVFRQPMTATHAKPATFAHRLSLGSTGRAVRRVQARLGVRTSGHYGHRTAASVRAFQRYHGLRDSGSVGRHTWSRLF